MILNSQNLKYSWVGLDEVGYIQDKWQQMGDKTDRQDSGDMAKETDGNKQNRQIY